jgi:oxysterol-binding protein 1
MNMKHAKLKLDQSDKQKFEIMSGGKGGARYHLRANHPVEANRWIFALTQAIQLGTAEAMTIRDTGGDNSVGGDSGSTLTRVVSWSERSGYGHRSTSSLDLRKVNSSAASIATEDDSGEDYPESGGEEPYKADFEVTAHSAKVQLEVLEKLLGSLTTAATTTEFATQRSGESETLFMTEDPVSILKKAARSLHGTLDELVRMSETRDSYWRGQVEREKELRRLWEENMEQLASEQEQMEHAMNTAIEQRRVTKRALRAMSIAVQQPDKGAEYIRRLSIGEVDYAAKLPSIAPEVLVPPEALKDVMSSDDEDEFFDALGSDAATIAGEEEKVHAPIPASKEATSKEEELALSARGYEIPFRTQFEKLDKDNRPKISLWGILKSMVGKDMTKMVHLPLYG